MRQPGRGGRRRPRSLGAWPRGTESASGLFPFVLDYPEHAEPRVRPGRQRLVVASGCQEREIRPCSSPFPPTRVARAVGLSWQPARVTAETSRNGADWVTARPRPRQAGRVRGSRCCCRCRSRSSWSCWTSPSSTWRCPPSSVTCMSPPRRGSGWSAPTRSPSAGSCCWAAVSPTPAAGPRCTGSAWWCSSQQHFRGLAVGPGLLIASRVVQGIGAVLLAPAGLSLLVTCWPARCSPAPGSAAGLRASPSCPRGWSPTYGSAAQRTAEAMFLGRRLRPGRPAGRPGGTARAVAPPHAAAASSVSYYSCSYRSLGA